MSAAKVLLIVSAVLFVLCVVLLLLLLYSNKRRKLQKETIDKLASQVIKEKTWSAMLETTVSILRNNREAADEKISEMHDGDTVGNALDVLSKRGKKDIRS